jgi:glycosyltransferase involved in cell wall biosynthesis
MKVLMLGWELPPYFAGGVGVVARALIDALAERDTEITYVMPRAPKTRDDELARVLGADDPGDATRPVVPSRLAPYWESAGPEAQSLLLRGREPHAALYGPELVAEVRHLAHAALHTAEKRDLRFDVIHAHDWTTFPAALALGRATGKPVVVHVHITEFDKSGGPHADPDLRFATPSEVIERLRPVGAVDMPDYVSWADQERDLTAWLGNDMQRAAAEALHGLLRSAREQGAEEAAHDLERLSTSDHFYYMCTK